MFVAITNDNGYYVLQDEAEACELAEHFEIDFNRWSFNILEVDVMMVPDDYHDGETLTKVRLSLVEGGLLMHQADEVVRILLNNGILFRERIKETVTKNHDKKNVSCQRCSMHLGLDNHSTEQHDEALTIQMLGWANGE